MIHGETDINISSCCITLKKSDQAQKKSTHVQPCPYSSTAVTDCSRAPYSLLLTARELHTTLLNVHREFSQLHVTHQSRRQPKNEKYNNTMSTYSNMYTITNIHVLQRTVGVHVQCSMECAIYITSMTSTVIGRDKPIMSVHSNNVTVTLVFVVHVHNTRLYL